MTIFCYCVFRFFLFLGVKGVVLNMGIKYTINEILTLMIMHRIACSQQEIYTLSVQL